MHIRSIVPAEGAPLDRILYATYEIWHDGLSRESYERYWVAQRRTPWGRSHLDRVALVDGDTVLASEKRYRFDATIDGKALRVIGLGAIFTQPEHRRSGAAQHLIEEILAAAAAEGIALALLFSEIGADYYAPLGFTAIATHDVQVRVTESTRHGAPMTMVRAGEERDLADIVAMGTVRAGGYRFHLERGRDLIHYAIAKRRLLAGFGPPGMRELQFFIAEEGASAVAYVVISAHAGEWRIEECGDRDPGGARLGALLQVLIARDPAERRPAIRAALPHGFMPPQLSAIASEPSPEIMMVRALCDDASAALCMRDEVML